MQKEGMGGKSNGQGVGHKDCGSTSSSKESYLFEQIPWLCWRSVG